MIKMLVSFLLCIFLSLSHSFSQAYYFYPDAAGSMNPSIPTPEKFLGYTIGSQHTRHDKIVEYIKELSKVSDRVSFKVIGETYQWRV